ncbi:unnamed protein product, partial [Linum tenue]
MATDTGWFATAFSSASSLFFGTFSCPSIDTTGASSCSSNNNTRESIKCNSTFLPPINRRRHPPDVLVHERPVPTRCSPEHDVVVDLGVSISVLELVARHVGELVQLQLVRLVHLVGLVNVHDILLEHIEPLVLIVEARGDGVMAPPPLVQIPQALLGCQLVLVVVETVCHAEDQSQRQSNQQRFL